MQGSGAKALDPNTSLGFPWEKIVNGDSRYVIWLSLKINTM